MAEPVNLTNLRGITGGDKRLECELFTDFIKASEENICAMEKALISSDILCWKNNAHLLKGASQSLGENKLTPLAERAEKEGNSDVMQNLLVEIQKRFHEIKIYLLAIS